jgi:hypothetical protein
VSLQNGASIVTPSAMASIGVDTVAGAIRQCCRSGK